jgi:hypothetical protein
VGPKQLLLTGRRAGSTNLTVFADNDESQTVDVDAIGDKSAIKSVGAAEKWTLESNPIGASRVPGFLQFNFKGRTAHIAVSQIAAIVVQQEKEKNVTKIVFKESGIDGELPGSVTIDQYQPEDVLEMVKAAKGSQ